MEQLLSAGALAYVSLQSRSGLADYAHEQAAALVERGVSIRFLTTAGALKLPKERNYPAETLFLEAGDPGAGGRLARGLTRSRRLLANIRTLAAYLQAKGVRKVLMGSYSEFLAPCWAWRLRRLAERGFVFGSVVHDPVRNTVVGPHWWHRQSIADAYSFLREAFVHDQIQLDTVKPVPNLRTTVIPHGPYRFSPATRTREQVREEVGVPSGAFLVLAFGSIRDSKNLNLAIRALVGQPKVHLLTAGKEQSRGQRPAAYYQELARAVGVSQNCHWKLGFVPEEEIGNLFVAADAILLTYSREFRSASGVLNAAVHYRRPCLASGGEGNLKSSVARFGLGRWVEPDDETAIARTLRNWELNPREANWDAYEQENSWSRNAKLVLDRMGLAEGASA